MKYLLDTHALLWWLFDDVRLSATVRAGISSADNDIWVSAASAWEITTKHRLGKLRGVEKLVADFESTLTIAGFKELVITSAHAVKAGAWAVPHRDPFDRMLAAQSALEGAELVTRDPAFSAFEILTVW